MLRQKLSQKQIQKLSPQQIQLMKLLQIPTATLDQRVKEELEANPALDEGNEDNRNTGTISRLFRISRVGQCLCPEWVWYYRNQ